MMGKRERERARSCKVGRDDERDRTRQTADKTWPHSGILFMWESFFFFS